ncbi:MAG: DNRLRE domain-containing protein, partial [Clostridium sp.]
PKYSSTDIEFIVDKLSIGKYIEIDITSIFNKWLSNEIVNNGITIYPHGDEGTIVHFSSTESSKPPILEYEL